MKNIIWEMTNTANFDSRTYPNSFWIICETSKNRPKLGTRTPYITKIFQKTKRTLWTPF